MNTVAAYRPTVVEPPFGKVAVAGCLAQCVAHVGLNFVCAGNGFVPAHGHLVVEVVLTAKFEVALFLDSAFDAVLILGLASAVGCALVVECVKVCRVNADYRDTCTLEVLFVVENCRRTKVLGYAVETSAFGVGKTCFDVVLVTFGNVFPHVFDVVGFTFGCKFGDVHKVTQFRICLVATVAYVKYVGRIAAGKAEPQRVAVVATYLLDKFHFNAAFVFRIEVAYDCFENLKFHTVAVCPEGHLCRLGIGFLNDVAVLVKVYVVVGTAACGKRNNRRDHKQSRQQPADEFLHCFYLRK